MLTSGQQERKSKQRKIRNSEYYDMEGTFDRLYAESKKDKTFNHLMEIIESEENIKLAYRTIKKNTGSDTSGVDKRTIADLAKLSEEEYVRLIRKQFSNYHPRPVRRVEIPKPNGKTRPLGIPTIVDRIVQQCILQVMEPICEAKFSENSNGFRPNRSAETAIAQCMRLIQVQHLYHVVDLDIKGFFDNISHTKLIRQIWALGIRDKKLLCIIKEMLKAPVVLPNGEKTYPTLENNVFQAQSIAQKHNCNLRRLDFQQESGLMSSLPLAQNLIEIRRGLTTSSTAIFVPFTTQELFQNGGETLYYGLNALSNNLIMVDRKKLKNPNGLILGTPGSGKSFSAKREITNAFLVTDDDIIICDPEAEYAALVHKFNGQVVKISSSSTNYINPMDINLNYSEDDNPVALKADFILSLCELIMGSKDGLQPIEKTVIDRCVHQIYQRYFDNPAPENMPILEDLYDALLKQDEKEAHHVATALEIYVKGSLKLFNNRTNVDIQNRLVCFDIKELGNQLKKIGMLIVQDQVWGRVTANRSAGKSTRYYIDEFHLLLKEEQTATYSVEIWKRFRKWGGLPTGITQNVKDLLRSPEIANILENSDFIYMLNQASDDRSILAQRLNISPHQLSYVTNSGEGEGLLFYGNVILPFIDRFPTDLELYRIMTTKLNEVAQEKEA